MPHVDRGWSAEKGHYGGGDAGETMSNAALLLVHATTARFGQLESGVRNRSPALDRQAVGSVAEALLGARDRLEFLAELLGDPRLELVLGEVLAVVVATQARELVFDAIAVLREQPAGVVVIHCGR